MTHDSPECSTELLQFVRGLAAEAGELTLQWFDRGVTIDVKSDGTPVTIADRSAERLIRERIASAFPDDAIVGEEEADVQGVSGRTWIIDPIDGTKSFVRGVPLYSTLLAVEDESGCLAGAISLPALGTVTYAGRGRGAWRDDVRVHVSTVDRLQDAVVVTSGIDPWNRSAFNAMLDTGANVKTWGDGYGWAMVVEGRADVIVDPSVSRWDVAAMPVLFAEAGGRYSDFSGDPIAQKGSSVATNGVLHDQVLALLNENRD